MTMKPSFTKIQTLIDKNGQLTASRQMFLKRNVELFGPRKLLPARQTIAARLTKAGAPKPQTTITVVGDAPPGFGKTVNWHPNDAKLAVIVFLNAADPLGVMISGVKTTDVIRFVSATGNASFSEETENEGVGAFIGVVAAGATATAAAFGAPELAPVIGAAEKFAKDRFKEKKVKTKVRDAFGEDPGSGHKARQEGGVVVSLPTGATTQNFISGNSDHKERWIKEPGTRDAKHQPDHMKGRGAFFLQSGSTNKGKATADGDIIIYSWDHQFADNFGFYRLHVLLERGDGKLPDPGPVE
jgi:hypothetical protein